MTSLARVHIIMMTAFVVVALVAIAVIVAVVTEEPEGVQCRREVVRDFRDGDIPSLEKLDAELQDCGA